MEKTGKDYRQRIWKIQAKLFKPFNCDVPPFRTFAKISSRLFLLQSDNELLVSKIGTQCVHGRTCNVWGRSFEVILRHFISNMKNGYVNIKSATKIDLLEDSEALKKKVKKVYFKFDTLEFFRSGFMSTCCVLSIFNLFICWSRMYESIG